MAQNNSLSQLGSTTQGLFSSINKFIGAPQKPQPTLNPTPNSSPYKPPVTQGYNPGLIKPAVASTAPSPHGEPAKPTLASDVQGNKYQAPKPNPSVLAQQKALNKLGAGLIEDGITGPKTREAIAKYGAGATTPNTPSATNDKRDSSGLLVNPTDAKFDRNTGQPLTQSYSQEQLDAATRDARTQATSGIDTPQGRAGGLLNSGQLTDTEKGLLGGSAVDKANQKLVDLKTAMAKQFGNIESSPIPLEFQQGREQVLGRQFASQEAAAQQGVSNALANQSQLIGLAQAQAGRAQGAAGQVFGAGLNQQGSYGVPAFNPLTGTFTGGGQYGQGPEAGSNVQSIRDAQTQINTIDQSSSAINNNFSRAINYASNAGLTGSVPIVAGFQRLFGSNYLTNPAVIGFNQAIGALNTQLQSFGEQPIDPNTATEATLKQAQETVKKDLLTKKSNYQSFIDNFNRGGSSGQGGTPMFGSFF